jgi:hypothetical protein
MNTNDKTARLAGLLYVVTVVCGIFSLIYVPSQVSGHDDAAATASHIVASEFLFRLGIVVGTFGYVAFLVLPLVLYQLLNSVNRNIAIVMVALALACVPLDLVAIANQLDVLSLLNAADRQQAFTPEQTHARLMSLLDAYRNRILISEIFWGLWLLPFGYLVFRSGFLPRVLGVVLMLGCLGYLITFVAQIMFPNADVPGWVGLPAALGEIGIALWLLVVGARAKTTSP